MSEWTIKEIVNQLEAIRVQLTSIYRNELDNPNTLHADYVLRKDIQKIKKKYAQELGPNK